MKPGQFPIFSVQKSKVPAHTITHPFNLWTAHAPLIGRKSEDEMSTYHIDSGNPDFIFYTIKEKQVEPHVRNYINFFLFFSYSRSVLFLKHLISVSIVA